MERSTRLRLRRRLKNTQKGVKNAQSQAAEHLDKHVVRRWQKFRDVQRFVFGWLALVGLLTFGVLIQHRSLAAYYKEPVPAIGGIYNEGIVSEVSNLNPIFASTMADRSASALMFEPLLKYNDKTELIGALANHWSINEAQDVYSLKLRPGIVWHDGRPITSADVVFTFETIQHPDTGSPLNRSWRDIKVEAKDDSTVEFRLPNAFTPFIHSLTRVGILPKHVLGEVEPKELRAHPFNLAPRVGSGPFVFGSIALDKNLGQIRLTGFDQYYGGTPKLDEIIIQTFADHEQLVEALNDRTVSGAAGLRTIDLAGLDKAESFNVNNPSLYNNVLVFFNMGDDNLKDNPIRKALVQSTNNRKIFDLLGGKFRISDGPLLKDQLGYDPKLAQYKFDADAADKALDKLGWKRGEDGLRYKGDQKLEFKLVTQNSDEYPVVAEEIQRQWRERGISLQLQFVLPSDLQQSHIVPHNYQILLLGVDQGVDPDVFVYWHSSQAKVGGFNFSEFKDVTADDALEAGRTRIDPELRSAKFESFLTQWRKAAPAVALYRPGYFYVQSAAVEGFNRESLPDPVGRFFDVHNWTIKSNMVKKPI